VDGRGVPLSVVVTGANCHDVTQVGMLLESLVVTKPEVTPDYLHHLCADKGYDSAKAREYMIELLYTPNVKSRGEEIREKVLIPGYRARRWVVEACNSWLNRFRKLLVRYEKTHTSYLALLHLACAIIAYRKITKTIVIYG